MNSWPMALHHFRSNKFFEIAAQTVAVMTVTIAAITYLVIDAHKRHEQELASQVSNISFAVTEDIRNRFQEIDNLLTNLRATSRASEGRITSTDLLISSFKFPAYVSNIAWYDAKGKPLASIKPLLPEFNVADRDFFLRGKYETEDHLILSEPLVTRLTGVNSIVAARRISDDRGQFAGMIAVAISIDTTAEHFASFNLGERGGIALLGLDDMIRMGSGIYGSLIGRGFHDYPTRETALLKSSMNSRARIEVAKQVVKGEKWLLVMSFPKNLPLSIATVIDFDMATTARFTIPIYLWLGAIVLVLTCAISFGTAREIRLKADKLKLSQEKEKAAAVAEARTKFLAVMSHEIRTPLNGVISGLELVCPKQLEPRSAKALQIAKRSGAALQGLIDDILLFSRSDHAPIELTQDPFSLAELCSDIQEAMLASFIRRSLARVSVGGDEAVGSA